MLSKNREGREGHEERVGEWESVDPGFIFASTYFILASHSFLLASKYFLLASDVYA
jgi:hypothetical protein